jgi:hypothetical protein
MARAVEPIARLLRSGEATLESLRSSHAAYRRMWANYRRGRFIPQLWRWIEDNDWRYAPDEAQIKSAFNPAEREAEAEAQKTAARLAREIAEDAEREKRAQEKRERALAEWRQLKAEGRIL